MAPVEVLKLSPDGKEGLMDQAVTLPPTTVGGVMLTAVSRVKVMLEFAYVMLEGGMSLMVRFNEQEIDPAVLFAQTVYSTAEVCSPVGVPPMVPLALFNDRPRGRAGEMAHDVGAPPPTVAKLYAMRVPFVSVRFSTV